MRGPAEVRRGAALQDLGIIEDGSILIRDGTIVAVGSTRRIENLKEAREAIDIPVHGRVLMPAFVDAGLRLSLSRSETSYKPKRVAEFHEDSLNLLRACLQHGTVTADIKACADGRDYHSDIAVLRQLAKIGSNPVRMRRTWRIASRSGLPQPNGNDDLWETLDAPPPPPLCRSRHALPQRRKRLG